MGNLSGLKMLDLSRLLPGPYCSLLLADLGMEVLKIEDSEQGDYIYTIVTLQLRYLIASLFGSGEVCDVKEFACFGVAEFGYCNCYFFTGI